jgi:hypothetical protein
MKRLEPCVSRPWSDPLQQAFGSECFWTVELQLNDAGARSIGTARAINS